MSLVLVVAGEERIVMTMAVTEKIMVERIMLEGIVCVSGVLNLGLRRSDDKAKLGEL